MENELTPKTGAFKSMSVVSAYDRVTFPYTDNSATASASKKVTQDSLASHRNSHR